MTIQTSAYYYSGADLEPWQISKEKSEEITKSRKARKAYKSGPATLKYLILSKKNETALAVNINKLNLIVNRKLKELKKKKMQVQKILKSARS